MTYRREQAVTYAQQYWNGAHPAYERFPTDCTNFVSQCLFAGGVAMDYTKERSTGWWYVGRRQGKERWSYSWSVAHAFYTALRAKHIQTMHVVWCAHVAQLYVGDVIFYDFSGSGRMGHSALVTSVGEEVRVHAHTMDVRDRIWHYRDGSAWTTSVRYAFAHIQTRTSPE